ncbi:hypothetical protein OG21DRAFT_1512606, partial [Imleria badia]
SITSGLLALLVFLFLIVNLYLHFFNCPLYPSTMNAIRLKWEKEVAGHDLLLKKWQLEIQDHATTVAEWKLEAEWHERDEACQTREEGERRERVRQEWAQEFKRPAREAEEYEKMVARRVHEEQERQEKVQKERDQEVKKHRGEWEEMERRENQRQESERQEWAQEVERHACEKLNMFRGSIEAHACTTYATRDYTAQLMNPPVTWEHRVEACKATTLEVHGMSYLPKHCEDKGPGAVIGKRVINQHEPAFWLWYKDKESPFRPIHSGCTSPGSGKRVSYESSHRTLPGKFPRGSDWREFCATTPAYFHWMQFSGAQECFQLNKVTYGLWQIDDTNCQ